MNIRNLHPLSLAPTRSAASSVRSQNAPSEESKRPQLRIVRDKVVISYRARVLLDEMRQTPDVDLSIKTLLGTAPLTDERAGEVLERIHHGYYNQPGVLKEVASVLRGALESEP